MRKMIHQIRKQPEEVKIHILNIFIFAAAIVLILLWIYSLGTSLTSSDTQAKISQDLEPLSALKDNLIGGYNSMPGSQ